MKPHRTETNDSFRVLTAEETSAVAGGRGDHTGPHTGAGNGTGGGRGHLITGSNLGGLGSGIA